MHTSPAAALGSGDAGGMNVVVRQQAEVLARLGHHVEILTRRASPDGPTMVELSPGLSLRLLDAGPRKPIAKGDHEQIIATFTKRLGALEPYDIIHSHHWFSGMAAVPIARATGAPHVQSFHSIAAEVSTPLSAGERPESPGRLAGEAWLARESDAIVTVSRAEAHTVVTRLGGAAGRTWVVPPGVDSALFHPKVSPPDGEQPDFPGWPRRHVRDESFSQGFVVAAGRLHPLKGFDLAIEAIAAMPKPFRPQLVIAGEPSEDLTGYGNQLTTLATRLGVANIVHFIGPQRRYDLGTLFREARVVLIPSHSETYGLVALEAAASGVPVVAAASGGLSEAVIDGETGIVLPSRDPQVWAGALSELLANPDLTARLSQAARQRAEGLTWTRSTRELLKVYSALLDRAVQPAETRSTTDHSETRITP